MSSTKKRLTKNDKRFAVGAAIVVALLMAAFLGVASGTLRDINQFQSRCEQQAQTAHYSTWASERLQGLHICYGLKVGEPPVVLLVEE